MPALLMVDPVLRLPPACSTRLPWLVISAPPPAFMVLTKVTVPPGRLRSSAEPETFASARNRMVPSLTNRKPLPTPTDGAVVEPRL